MTQYIGIRSEGGLVPYDILDQIAREESGLGQQAKDFGLAAGRRLTDEITRAWSDAQDYWHIFQRRTEGLPEGETGTTLTRKWVTDLLNELLGYELTYHPAGAVIRGKTYPISHRAGTGEESPPIDIEGFKIDLDTRPQARRLSPQALVQEYLNNSDEHLWGIVTNGMLLRLLRDTSRTSRPSYLQFDLQSILNGNLFNEFSLFYRLCHRSRLPKTVEDSTSSWLEKYFQLSIEQGGRIREELGKGVKNALESLGTGLLRHPKNESLRERITSGTLTAHDFHRQLLRLVYRLLFLMVAEERRMIVPEAPDSERRQRLYNTFYSVGRLRNLAEKVIERSTFGDLWLSLRRTFSLFENGDSNPLGIPPLNGDLFSGLAVKDLQDTHLYNDNLLEAMRRLSLFEENKVLQRVNYGALDVEELGSVYESLLDFQPVFVDEPEGKNFDLRTGSERKSTGSYYTRPELVRELIESALVPVMKDKIANANDSDPAKDKEKKQRAILTMSICDPACGSGHFLLAAARRLGRELAKVRTGEEEPTPKEFHLAVRDVISHCVYGVDVNPLAVDLCKLALWLEGHWTGKPLSFLDHHIKSGNSLIGVLDPSILKEGIPDDAFTAVTGDDKKVASAFKKRNREERKGQPSLPFDAGEHVHQFAAESQQLVGIVEDTPADVRRKEEIYRKAREQREWVHDWTAANLWTTAFFAPLTKYDDPVVPTYETFMAYLRHGKDRPQMTGASNAFSVERHFFHWRLEFPEVFDRGGFDVVLGNPPWETLQPEEVRFFAGAGAPEIAMLNGAARKEAIEELATKQPGLYQKWRSFQRDVEIGNKFVRGSGRFTLTAVGKLNTYALFAETATTIMKEGGGAGVIVPTGIATDDTYKEFFADLNTKRRLASLYDFENRDRLFPDVYYRMKFALVTVRSLPVAEPSFAFYLTRPEQIRDGLRRFTFTTTDMCLVNPNTQTCPVFRTRIDAELTKKLYRRVPVLVNETTGDNPWGLHFRQGLFNMTSDSDLFFDEPAAHLLPLYEGKMIQAYDHRAASIVLHSANVNRDAQPEITTDEQHRNPFHQCKPRYWVGREHVDERLADWKKNWLLGFKDVASTTNERTSIFTVLPRVGAGHTLPIVFFKDSDVPKACCFLACCNSLVLDYVARQKLGGLHLTFGLIRQLPVLSPESFTDSDREFIVRRVLHLVYTSHDLAFFAQELGFSGAPFKWDSSERGKILSELDAFCAHVYGLARSELAYILDPQDVLGPSFPGETFRTLKERDIEKYGEYRTRRLVLESFDKLAESPRFRDEMPKRESAFAVPEMAVRSTN